MRRGIARILEAGTPGEVYNIGGHNGGANLDIVNLLCRVMDERFADDPALATRFPMRRRPAASVVIR